MLAYLDMPSGLSGDMFLGCLIDAGWPVDELRRVVAGLGLPSGSVEISAAKVMRGAVQATHVKVGTAESHHHRNIDDVREILRRGDLADDVRRRAEAVFMRLASAEAQVHGTTADKVHFHEVGALDAIADIVGVCAGLAALGIDRLYASAVPAGGGWVSSQHGPLPLPAPATLILLASVNAPVCPPPSPPRPASHAPVTAAPQVAVNHAHGHGHAHAHHEHNRIRSDTPQTPNAPRELVTPTAAALLAELATFSQPTMRLHRIGTGAGTHQFPWPNIARLWLGEPDARGALVQMDTNIDDMSPQFYAPVCEALFAAGALDVWLTPVHMKKGRPGVVLSVLVPATQERAIADVLLRQTTTFGVRVHRVERHEAGRQLRSIQTPWGAVTAKVKIHEGRVIDVSPEYEHCRQIAAAHNLPLHTIYEAVRQSALAGTPCAPAEEHDRNERP